MIGRMGGLKALWVLVSVMLIALPGLAGCQLGGGGKPGQLIYKLPTTLTVHVGAELPGSGIRYERMGKDGAEVTIRGQQALKRKGDSLDWSGNPIPGVSIDLKQRVVWYTEEELRLAGTAKIVIDDVNPQPATGSPTSPVKYTGPVTYNVSKGAPIPGTTVTFDGQDAEGAKLGGISGYPYRKGGDSILWEGALREGVRIRLDVRVLQFDGKGMRVGGLVTLWIGS